MIQQCGKAFERKTGMLAHYHFSQNMLQDTTHEVNRMNDTDNEFLTNSATTLICLTMCCVRAADDVVEFARLA
jgi:hypothetical protein